jgi:hypothetical protein
VASLSLAFGSGIGCAADQATGVLDELFSDSAELCGSRVVSVQDEMHGRLAHGPRSSLSADDVV